MALGAIALGVRINDAKAWVVRAISWIRGNRMVVFVLAILLVGVPTFAALFPGFIDRTHRPWRVATMAVWLAAAALATFASQSRESAVHSLTRANQRLVLRQFLALLLGPQTGVPAEYRFSVYLLDDSGQLLLPWYPDQSVDPDDPAVFMVGQGAVGYALERGELVFAVGDAVSSGEFGLSPAQQLHFARCHFVAAAPIRLLEGQIVGTLGVISHINDGYFVSSEGEVRSEKVQALESLADQIGDILSVEGIEWDL